MKEQRKLEQENFKREEELGKVEACRREDEASRMTQWKNDDVRNQVYNANRRSSGVRKRSAHRLNNGWKSNEGWRKQYANSKRRQEEEQRLEGQRRLREEHRLRDEEERRLQVQLVTPWLLMMFVIVQVNNMLSES